MEGAAVVWALWGLCWCGCWRSCRQAGFAVLCCAVLCCAWVPENLQAFQEQGDLLPVVLCGGTCRPAKLAGTASTRARIAGNTTPPIPPNLHPRPSRLRCRSCAAAWACPPQRCACAAPTASRASLAALAPALWTQPTRWGAGLLGCWNVCLRREGKGLPRLLPGVCAPSAS